MPPLERHARFCLRVRVLSSSEIDADLREGIGFLSAALVIDFGCFSAAGFVAAHIARRAELLHAGIVGVIGALLSFLVSAGLPLWFNVVSIFLVIPSSVLGAYVAKKKDTQLAT